MSGWDSGKIYSTFLGQNDASKESRRVLVNKCFTFLEQFSIERSFIYREQLSRNVKSKQFYLDVDIQHLVTYDEGLGNSAQSTPEQFISVMEDAAELLHAEIFDADTAERVGLRIHLSYDAPPSLIRDLDSSRISTLVRTSGIVVSASTPISKPILLYIKCKFCSSGQYIPVDACFGNVGLPRTCPGIGSVMKTSCSMDPFVIVPERSKCIDQQIIKLQEAPESLAVGDLPRHIIVVVDRSFVNKAIPGARITINGIYTIFQSKQTEKSGIAIRHPYIRAVGMEVDASSLSAISEQLEREAIEFSRQPDVYRRIYQNIAPSIYGNDDIKRALACLLFGGSRKCLPDKMNIRGDINILLLGDPGTAKSQLLKFIEKAAPVSVYTSGKGSSAAGLTASVIRDAATGEFYLEGGAMVLADGGVVCIDEFDKMRDEDRVAIHEAMEQQTISIAKAGITTVLNSRTSVLAAANPLFGRYDDMKSASENIDFSSTILSRFDMIFIVRDDHNFKKDISLSKHVIEVHMGISSGIEDEMDISKLRQYVSYCRRKCSPRLSGKAAEQLSNHYVLLRSQVGEIERHLDGRSPIPITIRQLEAIIRVAEALAKMTLSPVVTEDNVDEALRLFRVSTMQAIQSSHVLGNGRMRLDLAKDVEAMEKWIKEKYQVGSTIHYVKMAKEARDRGFDEYTIAKCLDIMERQEKLLFTNQKRVIIRQK